VEERTDHSRSSSSIVEIGRLLIGVRSNDGGVEVQPFDDTDELAVLGFFVLVGGFEVTGFVGRIAELLPTLDVCVRHSFGEPAYLKALLRPRKAPYPCHGPVARVD
jgi:hypothetical protein